MNREFLQLAHTYLPKHRVGGWLMSEKLDGQRAYWDGGITRGMAKGSIPWANTAKDARLLKEQISTGLWSRYGNVIHADPDWLDQLPHIPLDGELYNSDLSRQQLMSIIKCHEPDLRWEKVQYHCFDMPAYESVFRDGRINNPNFKLIMHNVMGWLAESGLLATGSLDYRPDPKTPFETIYYLLKKWCAGVAIAHRQVQLPFQTNAAIGLLEQETARIVANGGEGMVVRSPSGVWTPKRVRTILKVKPTDDAEAVVTGYTTGRVGVEGKHLGRMGALITEYQGKRLELAGFRDSERGLIATPPKDDSDPLAEASLWAERHPGEDTPPWIMNPKFPRGTIVTFRYRGKSDDGIPQEARYWRVRNEY